MTTMRLRSRNILLVAVLAACVTVMTGCLHRRIRIVTDPPGALVHLNDVQIGLTPVEVDFTYFGVYDVRVNKRGYEPISTSEKAKAPIYEWPGLDLIAEIIPVDITTEIEWSYTLTPIDNDIDGVLERARQMRDDLVQDEK